MALSAFALTALAGPSSAAAFCRESLDSHAGGDCVEDPGVPFLFWKRACMTYRFNEDFFARVPLMTEDAIRQAFNASFETWAVVDCDGRKPFAVLQASKTTATSKAEFLYDVVNESVVVARSREEWASLKGHDPTALALTLLWHDKSTGEILDVDMELNAGAGRFNDCVSTSCSLAMIDLQNTITHEAGHLLGLGHTNVRGATMEASTDSNRETSKRSLERDDVDGYCSLDLPEFDCTGSRCVCPAPPIVSSHTTVRTCGCRTVGADPVSSPTLWSAGWTLFGYAWVRVTRRKRPARGSGRVDRLA